MDDRTETPEKDAEAAATTSQISAIRLALKNFHSQWFLMPQGTGILAVILHNLHYQFRGLVIISQILWVLTIVMLSSMLIIYIIRALVFPSHVRHQLSHNTMETACLSSISIAFTTIIQMIALNLVSSWGTAWGMVAFVLWWINLIMATVAVVGTPYVFVKYEAAGVNNLPIATLLPLIASLTAAAGGGVICRYGELSATLQIPVLITSYLSIGLAFPFALLCDAAFLAQFLNRSWPTEEKMFSLMILCGPFGQGSFALQILGDCVHRGVFAEYNTSSLLGAAGGKTVSIASMFFGLLTWGFSFFWWAIACIAILNALAVDRKPLMKWDQSLAAWSLVFPWGVYTNAAVELGTVLDSIAFNIVSTILTILLVILWLLNMAGSITGIVNGKVFGLQRGWRPVYSDDSVVKQQ